jgi:hypothetical protein
MAVTFACYLIRLARIDPLTYMRDMPHAPAPSYPRRAVMHGYTRHQQPSSRDKSPKPCLMSAGQGRMAGVCDGCA